jgi:hypothetical protein
MMNRYDMQDLLGDMLAAARKVFTASWQEVRPFAELEFRHFTENLSLISELHDGGKITDEEARLQMNIQKDAARSVLASIEGIRLVTVENALNAALSVIRTPVNKALGWALL